MKRSRKIAVLVITLIMVTAAGCGGAETTQEAGADTAAQEQQVALPEEAPALIGKVKEIVGNEVTVFKAELPQNQTAPAERPVNQNSTGQGQNNAGQSRDNPGQRPLNKGMAMNFTEETETFLIPVGTPIVSMQRGTGKASQVALTDIKKDTILRVWKQDGNITFVQVAGGNTQRSSDQTTQNNRQGTGAGGGMPPVIVGPPAAGGNR